MAQVPGMFNIQYSTKNIPLVNKFKYQKLLTVRVEDVIRRMRWKLFWEKNKDKRKKVKNDTYGFPTMTNPPYSLEMRKFEDDLIGLIAEVEMRLVSNNLQDKKK